MEKLNELLAKWEARSRDALPADAMLVNKHIRELTEALAVLTPESLQRDSALDAALEQATGMYPYDFTSQSFALSGQPNIQADGDDAFFSKKKVHAWMVEMHGRLQAVKKAAGVTSESLQHGTPHTLGGLRGAFVGEFGRQPTEQEIWNGAIKSWRDLNPAPKPKLPDSADTGTAPAFLNLNDKAMWSLGWNECLGAAKKLNA